MSLTYIAVLFILGLMAAAIVLVPLRDARHRAQARKGIQRRRIDALCQDLGVLPNSPAREQFERGFIAGEWFVDSNQGPRAVMHTFELTVGGLTIEHDWYELGWYYAVKPAWLRAGGSRYHPQVLAVEAGNPSIYAPNR